MRIIYSGDSVLIQTNYRDQTFSFTHEDIISKGLSLGYNSYFLDPYYMGSTAGYWIRYFNATLVNGELFLIQLDKTSTWWVGSVGSGYNRFYDSSYGGVLQEVSGTQISYSDTTFGVHQYKYYQQSKTDISEPCFGTSLPYSKIYLNDEDITPVTYNWVSVPSISGKNGILSLAQIASDSINDGEPVSDAAATAFSDLPAECNVGEIIDELLPYEESLVDVLVKYKVKGAVTGAFDYVKLVAKKGSIPKSVEDGDKVVDINPSKKSKLVTGLDEGSKYYFVIFIKDSEDQTAKSNEMWIITGAIPIPTDLRPYVDKLHSVLWGLNNSNTLLGYLDTTGNSNYWVLDDVYSYVVSGNFNSNGNQYYFYVLSYCAIHVTSGENSVSVSYDYVVAPYNVIHTWGRGTFGPYDHSGNSGNYIETRGDSTGINFYSPYNVDDIGFTLTTSFETMLECFTYLATHFRRIRNLYVDGVPWLDYGESVNKTMYELAKTHDLTSMQINNIGGSTLTDHTVDSLSSYFGTVNILVAERENGNHIDAYDGNNASGRFTVAMTEAFSYIPITRCLIKSFTFKGKLTPYGTQWDVFRVQTGFINGSTIKVNSRSATWNGSSDWSTYTVLYDVPVMADYIIICGNDGQWEIKDFVAETVVYEE